jgi:HK97 family phage major capsid protein
MNPNALLRYQGAVSPPLMATLVALGISPIGLRKNGAPIWPVAGGSPFALTDLDALKTVEECATYIAAVAARITELDTEWAGKQFDDAARTEWAALGEIKKKALGVKAELEARRTVVEDLVKQGEGVAERPFAGRTVLTAPRHVPEDIFALEQYRNLSGSESEMHQAYRDGAMFAVERARYPHPQSKDDVERAHIATLLDHADQPSQYNPNRELARLVIATGSPEYLRAFTKYIQGRPLSSTEQFRAAAPLTVQTDATGGFAVPFYFDPTLLHVGAWTNVNPYRAAGTVKTIVGTDTYNGATVAAFTVGRAAEAAAAVEGPGAVGQISAIVGKVHGFGGLSLELLSDRPDIVSELASLIAEAKDTEEESIFSLGVGDALGAGFNPIGVFAAKATSGAYTELETIGNNVLAIGDAYAVEAALPIRHRASAAWFMGRAEIRAFQALETAGGQLFGGQNYASVGYPVNSPVGNTGLRMLQYPIWEVPSAPTGTTSNYVVAVLANGSSFYIIERAGMTVEVIPHIFDGSNPSMPLGRRGIYAWWRNTAKPASVDAGRRLTINAP